MKSIIIKYGLIGGFILVIMIVTMMMILGDGADFEKSENYGYLFLIAAFSTIFFGIREYRDKLSAGTINFNKGFRIGLLITVIASICYTIGWLIYFNFIDDSFMDKYTSYSIKKIQSSGKPAIDIATEIAAFKKSMTDYDNPLVMALNTFLKVFPIGFMITLICAMLMRRKPAVPAT